MAIVGTLVAESLAPGATVDLPIVIRRIHRVSAGSAMAGGVQPSVWTLLDFTCDDGMSDDLAAQLAAALLPGPWYADWAVGSSKLVVFSGKIFKIVRDDAAALAEVMEYARSVGVPEAQLDWER